MISKNRTAYDTLAFVLQKISDKPSSSTDLFHELKSSYEVTKKGLDTAVQFKLAERQGVLYCITPKGFSFLQVWKKLQTYLTEEQD